MRQPQLFLAGNHHIIAYYREIYTAQLNRLRSNNLSHVFIGINFGGLFTMNGLYTVQSTLYTVQSTLYTFPQQVSATGKVSVQTW